MSLNACAVDIEDVSVIRGGQPILTKIGLHVTPGRCCAILGPNGSGKSTLLSVLSGYTWPTCGTVSIGGQVYGRVDLGRVRRSIGLIEPSRSPAFDGRLRVRDVVATGLFGAVRLPPHEEISAEAWQRVETEIELFELGRLHEYPFARLSTGEQMKTLLARAMVSETSLLLLDEPTAGLDMGARAGCVGILDRLLARDHHPTLVIVSHHLDELPRSVDQVVLLKDGRVVGDGSPDEMLTSQRLSRLFDCRVEVFRDNGRYIAGASDDPR